MDEKNLNSIHSSPLRYPGGKSCIFPFVSKMFYENDLVGINYAEPYAGGAGLALKLLFEGYVQKIYINDYDKSIYSVWYAILNFSDLFCNWIENVDVNIESWRYYKEIHNNHNEFQLLDLAKATFFLNRTNISGVIKGGAIGGFEQLGNYKIDARFNKLDLIRRIKRIASYKSRIELSNLDGISFVQKMDKKKENIFIYLDPPYVQKGADLYMNFYVEKDHIKLAKYVKDLKNMWMVSYDNTELILSLYSNKHRLIYQLSQAASNRVGDEVLIFSDNIIFDSSKTSLKSAQQLIPV